MKLLLYSDESGNLGVKYSGYFVISILIVPSYNEYRKLEKSVQKFRKNKFKKELKTRNEIKDYIASKKLKLEMINVLNNLDIKSISIYIDKKSFNYKKLSENRHKNEIYIDILKELIKNMKIKSPVILRLDKYILRKFRDLLENNVYKEIEKYKTNSEIYHVDSEKYIGIQYADLIAWPVLKSLEDENKYYIEKLNKNHKIIKYESRKIKNK